MTHKANLSTKTCLALALLCLGVGANVFLWGQAASAAPALDSFAEVRNGSLAGAKALAAAGRFAEAERELRTYLSAHPGDSAALFALGSVLQRENKPKESLAAYTEGAKRATPTPEDLRIVALDYVLLEDYPDAIKWLDRAVISGPANAQAWYDLGRAEMMQQNFPRAEEALKRSLELIGKGSVSEGLNSAEAVKAENNLGVTYEGEGRSADAAQAYRTAIERQRSASHPSEQPLLNYGKLLIDQNHPEDAVGLLEQAIRIAPNDPKCHEQLARSLDRSGDRSIQLEDRAQIEMLEAIRLDPSNARLHFQLGLMYRRAGKAELSHEQMALSGSLYGSHSTATDH